MSKDNHFKRHSRLGIASTIIGTILPLLVTTLFVLTTFFEKNSDGYKGNFFESLFDLSLSALSIVGLLAPVLHLTGLVLGLSGAFSKETKKAFSIAGIILNLLFGLISIGIILLLFLFFKYACCAWR